MFTQCSKCETIFKLSAETLRSAGGQVRCGRCGEVFNALTRLAEEPGAFSVGESSFDLEERADRILGAAPAPAPPPGEDADDDYIALDEPGVQIARLDVQDWQDDEAPPRESAPAPVPGRSARGTAAARAAGGAGDAGDAGAAGAADARDAGRDFEHSLEFTLPPGELDRIFVATNPPVPAPLPDGAPGLDVPESVRRDMLEGIAQQTPSAAALAPQRTHQAAWWAAAAVLLAVLLAAQVVHRNRESLAAREPFGRLLHSLYARLGNPLPAPANLSGYQLRQWGVTGDPAANGALRVRASILNTTSLLQPYPLLRVTLQDRFGAGIGTRDFEPAEYLGKPATRLLTPGERADATIDIQDPGKTAEGFEIDVCTRSADRRVTCANDAAARPR